MLNVSLIDGHIDGNPTRFDCVKAMSIEELAEFMNECGHDFPPYCDYIKATKGICNNDCLKCAKRWLESEVDTE